jgi:allophanate hydrolase
MTKLSLDIRRLSAAYRDGITTPKEIAAEVLRRIESAGDDHVWISRAADAAVIRQADMLMQQTAHSSLPALYGIPFAVKDNIDVAGSPTTLACPDFSYVASKSATVVERLVAAGGIFIGKTNLDQFATGLVGVRSPYGIPRNPFNPRMVPGGSSSGSAVAVASGLVSFAVATDTAGSGRVPAAFNNVVGYKPTRGLFSINGLVPACRSVDCISIMTLTVTDALRVAEVVMGFDPIDPYSRHPPGGFALNCGAPPAAFRFGVPEAAQREFFGDAEAEKHFDAAIDRVVALGGRPISIDYRPWAEAGSLLYGLWVAERATDLGEFIDAHPDTVDPVVRDIILGGKRLRATDLFRGQHRLAELMREIDSVWRDIDFLLVPTTGTAYSIEEVLAKPVVRNTNLGYYTNFTNLLDMAGIAVPNGFTRNGFPIGVSLIGPAWHDARLFTYAYALERAVDIPLGATGISHPDHSFRTVASMRGAKWSDRESLD